MHYLQIMRVFPWSHVVSVGELCEVYLEASRYLMLCRMLAWGTSFDDA
jgi:hypothetical protein